MIARRTFAGLCLATVTCAVVAAPAWAGPSGDEYLPKVPSATGHQASSGGSQGESSGPTTTTSTTATTAGTTTTETAKGEPNHKRGKNAEKTAAIPAASNDGGSSGGGGSSMVPIVLLIVVGVIVTVVGMTLTRRRGMQSEPSDGAENRIEKPNARPTPDGEIVAGGDKPA
jgi:cobalamin biosynthesis Mg chelatase CobN